MKLYTWNLHVFQANFLITYRSVNTKALSGSSSRMDTYKVTWLLQGSMLQWLRGYHNPKLKSHYYTCISANGYFFNLFLSK